MRPRDRQLVALAAAHLAGDRDRLTALAREHLLDHPDSVLAAWITAGATGTASTGSAMTASTHPPTGTSPAHPSQEMS